MADNVNVTEGVGKTIGGDDISSVVYQRVKLIHGADGVNDGDSASSNPFPVTVNRVTSLVDGTVSVGTINRVNNVVDGTLSTVTRVTNVIDGTLSNVYRVHNLIAGTVTVTGITASAAVHILSTNGTMGVNVGTVAGSVAVYFSPARPVVLADSQHTAGIFTVTGSTSGGTTSGVTLVAPSANYNFKVFAYSLQSTAIASSAWRFTNGGGSETEFWRPLVTAVETTSTPKGANLAVQPPGFLFATGVSTTLALKSDTGSLVHYSVSYIKESA